MAGSGFVRHCQASTERPSFSLAIRAKRFRGFRPPVAGGAPPKTQQGVGSKKLQGEEHGVGGFVGEGGGGQGESERERRLRHTELLRERAT